MQGTDNPFNILEISLDNSNQTIVKLELFHVSYVCQFYSNWFEQNTVCRIKIG